MCWFDSSVSCVAHREVHKPQRKRCTDDQCTAYLVQVSAARGHFRAQSLAPVQHVSEATGIVSGSHDVYISQSCTLCQGSLPTHCDVIQDYPAQLREQGHQGALCALTRGHCVAKTPTGTEWASTTLHRHVYLPEAR
jgi:hypothetical protein